MSYEKVIPQDVHALKSEMFKLFPHFKPPQVFLTFIQFTDKLLVFSSRGTLVKNETVFSNVTHKLTPNSVTF